jgi:hypothetical protein
MNPTHPHDAQLDPEPSAEERAEAEALARALEPEARGATPVPDDALAAAALLRHARRAQAADESAHTGARIAAAGARVLPAVDRRRPRRRWLWTALLVPAATAALIVTTTMTARHRVDVAISVADRVVPAPSLTLLEAQAQAAHAGADLSVLDRQMREYRRAYYAAVGGGVAEEP